jgi:tetratricopeptide (TPR) repeat protein
MTAGEGGRLVADLRQDLANEQVVVLVGAGLSVGASGDEPVARWIGLLEDGVARCEELALKPLPDAWGERTRKQLHSGDTEELLLAAEAITGRLGGPEHGEYRRWLRETVGALPLRDDAVLAALRDLDVPLATTNYDGLLEQVMGWPAVTWRDGAQVQRVLRGQDKGVLHLHGHWDDPASVVLGVRSYERVLGDAHAQTMQQALAALRTLVFVGFGAGLEDPNFGALRLWMAKVLKGSEYRHYRLARAADLEAVRAQHGPDERVIVVPFGAEHPDLAPFLRRLREPEEEPPPAGPVAPPGSTNPAVGVSTPTTTTSPTGLLVSLPAPRRCFGRDSIIEDLVATWIGPAPLPTPLLGPPGIGKSTVSITALHDPQVVERFGARRYFVRCQAATSGEAMLAAVATTLGVELGGNLIARLLAALGQAPTLLVLDNAETPWEGDVPGTEQALEDLAGGPGLVLVASLRGRQRPFRPQWREAIYLEPLTAADARKVFLAVAGQRFADDPNLDGLLAAQDGLPLAVELLAYVAEAEPDLAGLLQRWADKRGAILAEAGSARTELGVNTEASFELSIGGPRMSDQARRLLSMLGVLPDGVAHDDVEALLPGIGVDAAAVLRRVGLAFDEAGRLRMLQPIRDHVQRHHPPQTDDLARAIDHYGQLARTLAPTVGWPGGAEASRQLAGERANLETMIQQGLKTSEPALSIQAALAMNQFMRHSGLGSSNLLEEAGTAAASVSDSSSQAAVLFSLGDLATYRSDRSAAQAYLNQALQLFEQGGDVLGQANAICRLGDLATRFSEDEQAEAHYEQALSLYEQVNNVLGQANSILGLAHVALRSSEDEQAKAHYEQALVLYRERRDILGQANCILGLGRVALWHSENEQAKVHFEQALMLFEQVGSLVGQGACLQDLGDLALRSSEDEQAKAHYEQALSLYKQVNNLPGQAGINMRLAQIALLRSDLEQTQVYIYKALELYESMRMTVAVGRAHRLLAQLALTPADKAHHVIEAREAWSSVGREDLIGELDREFGDDNSSD